MTTATTFLISFDLAVPAANKSDITSRIMSMGEAWARPLDQTWYVRATTSAEEIEAHLADLLDDDDGLLVQAIDADASFANTGLRWFKPRALAPATQTADVVPFPAAPTEEPAYTPNNIAA